MRKLGERGFTLPELVVVGVVFVLLLVTSLILLNPKDYTTQNHDSLRRVHLAAIAQGINRYVADTGQLPPGIPAKATAIGSPADHYNICIYLVPKYLNDVPLDPDLGIKTRSKPTTKTDPPCSDDGINYATGYAIQQDKNGSITISAPVSNDSSLKITIKPVLH